jgi:phage head maturation protease
VSGGRQREQLIFRLGVSADVMNDAAKDDRDTRRKRERLRDLCMQEYETTIEERIERQTLNRWLASQGLPELELPTPPNRAGLLEARRPKPAEAIRHARGRRAAPGRLPSYVSDDLPVVVGLVCPYSVRTRVADPPAYLPYSEEFLPGAFEIPQRRLPLVVEDDHEPVGVAVEFTDKPTIGLFGAFRLFGRYGESALTLIRSGFLTGLAPVFTPLESEGDALVVRKRVRLEKVALARFPAHEDAWVSIQESYEGTIT